MAEDGRIYHALPTFRVFHNIPLGMYDYMGVRGPVGSGKSVGMCWHIRTMAERQPAMRVRQKMSDRQYHGEKIRWSKWLIGRQTYKQLTEGTIPTWVREFPDTHITWSGAPHGYLFMPSMANDGTWVWIDLQFIAFESPTADDDLQGMEFSGVWVNEACQVPWHLIWRANTRVGRFQPFLKSEGVALEKFGVIMDTNSPNESNWWCKKEQIEKPEKMLWFVQPPALIRISGPDGKPVYLDNDEENAKKYGLRPAENVGGHADGFGYWRKMTVGGDEDDIKRLVLNEFGTSVAGKPIYPDFNPRMHVKEGLEFMPGLPLYMGTDLGLTPAMVFLQIGRDGVIRVLDELTSEDMTLDTFITSLVRPRLMERFGWPHSCRAIMNYCDPAGMQRTQTYGDTCIDLLNANGIPTAHSPDMTNDFRTRRDVVARQLKRLEASGAGFLVDKRCEVLIKGFNGHYCYKRLKAGGDSAERYAEGPDKSDFYTHVQDALQYAVLGATRCGISGNAYGYGGASGYAGQQATQGFNFGLA